MKNKIKVGDILFAEKYGRIYKKYTINKVGKLFAFSDKIKFSISYGEDGLVTRTSNSDWNVDIFHIDSPSIRERIQKQNIVDKLKKFEFNGLTLNQLKAIVAIIDI